MFQPVKDDNINLDEEIIFLSEISKGKKDSILP